MTRKHFQAMVKALREISDVGERTKVGHLLINICKSVNPRFNTGMFCLAADIAEPSEEGEATSQEEGEEVDGSNPAEEGVVA